MAMVAGDTPRPHGPAAQALVWDVWPQTSESALENLADHHEGLKSAWNDHGDATKTRMLVQGEHLRGAAGDAHQEAMQTHAGFAYDASDYHKGISTSVRAYYSATVEFKFHLTRLADEAEPVWQRAIASRVPGALQAVYDKYRGQVAEIHATALGRLAEAPAQPGPPAPPAHGKPAQAVDSKKKLPGNEKESPAVDEKKKLPESSSGKEQAVEAETGDRSAADSSNAADAPYKLPEDRTTANASDFNHAEANAAAVSPATDTSSSAIPTQSVVQQMPAVGQAASGLGGGSAGGGSGLGGGAGSLGSLTSGLRPASSATSGAGTGLRAAGVASPSGFTGAGAAAGSAGAAVSPSAMGASPFGAPLGGAATSSFGAGLSSGLGGPGAVSPAVPARSALPFAGQQVAAAAGPVSGSLSGTPAGLATGAAGVAVVDAAAPVSGGGAVASAPPMMGPMPLGAAAAGGAAGAGGAAAAQPLAPYSAPGGGAGAGVSSSTVPAGGGAQPGAAGAAAGPSGAGGTAPPVMAGAGSSGSAAGLAASQQDGNPDLAAAVRVLADVVRGTQASGELQVISWAVGVLRTPVGPQMVLANSVGGGAYIPARVFVPATARMAVLDPALPMGWADDFMGCQSPLRILAAHAERLSEFVAGVSVSAVATSEPYPRRRPETGDFAMIATKDILETPGEPARMDGAHLHRLAVVDPGLARRVGAVDRGGEFTTFASAHITRAVMEVAFAADETGQPLAGREDGEILERVNAGTADDAAWQAWQAHVRGRDGGAVLLPEIHAPQDVDDSAASVQSRMFYRRFYRMGRVAELVQCWRVRPVSLADLVYCGVAAGAGGQVGAVLAALEQQLATRNAVAGRTA